MSQPSRQGPEPKEIRIGIVEELLQAAQGDEIEDYAAAYDSLVEFERELGDFDSDQLVCAVCGCTDDDGCPGGCYWVADNLCSSCLVELAKKHGLVAPQKEVAKRA